MEIFDTLKAFHDRLLELAGSLRFDKRNLVNFNRVALYGSILELTGCIIILIQNNSRTGVPALFRTLLEASVELRNLAKDSNYLEYMNASHSSQLLTLL